MNYKVKIGLIAFVFIADWIVASIVIHSDITLWGILMGASITAAPFAGVWVGKIMEKASKL